MIGLTDKRQDKKVGISDKDILFNRHYYVRALRRLSSILLSARTADEECVYSLNIRHIQTLNQFHYIAKEANNGESLSI